MPSVDQSVGVSAQRSSSVADFRSTTATALASCTDT